MFGEIYSKFFKDKKGYKRDTVKQVAGTIVCLDRLSKQLKEKPIEDTQKEQIIVKLCEVIGKIDYVQSLLELHNSDRSSKEQELYGVAIDKIDEALEIISKMTDD